MRVANRPPRPRALVVAAAARRPPATAAIAHAAALLGGPPSAPLAAVRAAWAAAIAAAHPDAGGDDAAAVALNAAYETLTAARGGGRGSAAARRVVGDGGDAADPFAPSSDAPPSVPFIDPFAAGVDAFRWRELQALARTGGCADADDPAAALRDFGVFVPPAAAAMVTPAQADALESELAAWEARAVGSGYVDRGSGAAAVGALLVRARAANARWVRRKGGGG
jgi:hypothetical protein